jgi:hypothetical protein
MVVEMAVKSPSRSWYPSVAKHFLGSTFVKRVFLENWLTKVGKSD